MRRHWRGGSTVRRHWRGGRVRDTGGVEGLGLDILEGWKGYG